MRRDGSHHSRAAVVVGGLVLALGVGLVGVAVPSAQAAPAARAGAPASPPRVHEVYGYSVKHRPLVVDVVGDPAAPRRVLVVGCIHGNECDGRPVITKLRAAGPPAGTVYYLVPTANPDGARAHTRQNARGVDLNKNFPGHWAKNGHRGSTYYAGRHPLSEPESRAMWALIARVQPTLTIWYHQHMNLVDHCGGSLAAARAYAKRAHMRQTRLPRYNGSVATTQHLQRHYIAILTVELPAHVTAAAIRRHAAAVPIAALVAPGVPSTPQPPTTRTDTTSVAVTWRGTTGNGRRVVGYQLEDWTRPAGGAWVLARSIAVASTARSFVLASDGTAEHRVRVRAQNLIGWGQWSAFATAAPPPPPPTETPAPPAQP